MKDTLLNIKESNLNQLFKLNIIFNIIFNF